MLIQDQYLYNKAIMVAVIGEPNAGKSSLINYLLGFDLSAVTSKPQTTRNKIHCNLTIDHTEIILVDTPGFHHSNQELNKRMNEQAREGADGVDLNLLLIDLSKDILSQVKNVVTIFGKNLVKTWLVFTKSDLIEKGQDHFLETFFAAIKELVPAVEKYFVVSSVDGSNFHLLTGAICDEAQPGHHLYPDGSVSNKSERFFATEYIREQAFELLHEELPYELAVVIDEYKDLRERREREQEKKGASSTSGSFGEMKENKTKAKNPSHKTDYEQSPLVTYISATILVNRASQRAIVVGSKGSIIREIGMRARKKIEAMVGGRVHLNLHVKVQPKWFKNNFVLEELGLPRAHDSSRVWRKRS